MTLQCRKRGCQTIGMRQLHFSGGFLNSIFKTNDSLERGLITGITRISKESVFSDFNNLVVITTTSKEYATAFGALQNRKYFRHLKTQDLAKNSKVSKHGITVLLLGNTRISIIYGPLLLL